MTNKPEVVAFIDVHSGHGRRYVSLKRGVDHYSLTDGEQLIRLTDHEASRAADKEILDQLYRQRDDYAMHNMAVRQCIGIPASIGVNEPIEDFEERPQDLAPAVREMALIIEADKARIAELEQCMKYARTVMSVTVQSESISHVCHRSLTDEIARIDAAIKEPSQ